MDEVKAWVVRNTAKDKGWSVNSIVDNSHTTVRNIKAVVPRKGMTALNYAAFFGQLEVVRYLLQHGAGIAI